MEPESKKCIPLAGLIKSYDDLGPIEVKRFQNQKFLDIFTYNWTVEDPKATVILVHGITSHALFEFLEIHDKKDHPIASTKGIAQFFDPNNKENQHAQKKFGQVKSTPSFIPSSVSLENLADKSNWFLSYYNSIIHYMNQMQISVCALDLQSHGKSQGWMNYQCNVETFDDFCGDVLQLALLLRKRQNTPLYLFGISMGGGVVLRTAQIFRSLLFLKNGSEVPQTSEEQSRVLALHHFLKSVDMRYHTLNLQGVLALCPCLGVKGSADLPLNRLLLPLAPFVNKFAPNLRVATMVQQPQYEYVNLMHKLDNHNLYKRALPLRISTEVLEIGSRIFNSLHYLYDKPIESITPLRIFVMHSATDTLCEAVKSIEFCDALKNYVRDITLVILDKSWHALLSEPTKEENYFHIFKWLYERIYTAAP